MRNQRADGFADGCTDICGKKSLLTIMLTNVLNNNDSYVCNTNLYVRFPLNAIRFTTTSNRELIFRRADERAVGDPRVGVELTLE